MVSESSSGATDPQTHPIKTVVILVQENRSFDHVLGWFKSINSEIDGVTGTEANPISTTELSSSHVVFGSSSGYVDPDPDHSFQAIYEQVSGKQWNYSDPDPNPEITMNGFAQNAERTKQGLSETVMNGFKPEVVPVFKELVTEFAVCDRWFASLPASTQANRLFLHSATSHGVVSNDSQKLREGFPQKTIFESLEESGFSFGIYYQSFPTTAFYSLSPWQWWRIQSWRRSCRSMTSSEQQRSWRSMTRSMRRIRSRCCHSLLTTTTTLPQIKMICLTLPSSPTSFLHSRTHTHAQLLLKIT